MAFIVTTVIARNSAAVDPTNAQQVLNFSSEKSNGYKTFSADTTQTMNMLGTAMKVNARMVFKQPAMMRVESDMPMMGQAQKGLMVLGADKVLWQEMNIGSLKRVMKMDFHGVPTNSAAGIAMLDSARNMDPKCQLEAAQQKYNFTLTGTTKLDGQDVYLLEGTLRPDAKLSPQEAGLADYMGTEKMYIGRQDGFPHRVEIFDKSGTNLFMSMDLRNLKFNEDAPDSLFVYTPAPGVQVIDMTEMVKPMLSGSTPAQAVEPPAAPKAKPATP